VTKKQSEQEQILYRERLGERGGVRMERQKDAIVMTHTFREST
jgi:hypothetical protein